MLPSILHRLWVSRHTITHPITHTPRTIVPLTVPQTLGQQLAVWCHRTPDTLAIFTPIPGDTLSTAVSFARSMLNCDTAMDRALLLMPGQKRPVDPAVLHAAKPGKEGVETGGVMGCVRV